MAILTPLVVGKNTRQTEIGNFEMPSMADEQVRGFQILQEHVSADNEKKNRMRPGSARMDCMAE